MSESSSTKAEDLALVLEEAIVSGDLAPGSVLRQEELSARYRVSRTPVREALRRLAALGLVSFAPNRSVRVRTLSREELREAFLVRAELESLATGLAVPNMTDDDFAALDAAETRFAELTDALLDRDEPERARLTAEWVGANQAFHDVIYGAARAPLVERTAKSMRRTFLGQAVWRAGGHEIDDLYRRNVVQHRAICDALYARSAEGAKALAREHVMSSCRLLDVILDEMSRRPPAAAAS